VWKSVERFSAQPNGDTCPVHRIGETVNSHALSGGPERFTRFLIMNVLQKLLSSTETIAKLVEKSVQIPVRLAQFRNLIDRV
jgi:hypothetical protein